MVIVINPNNIEGKKMQLQVFALLNIDQLESIALS